MRRTLMLAVAILVVMALVAQAAGYVVILKNGHKIRCREPMKIEGPNAILTLVTGVVASYPLDQVDLVETERYNKLGLGDAIMVEELKIRKTPVPTPTPKRSLGHYATIDASEGNAELGTTESPTPTPTPGIKLRTRVYHDERVTQAFSRIFNDKRLFLYSTSVGTQPDYFFVQATTDAERDVFNALEVVAEAFVIIHRLHPDMAPAAVEMKMVETGGKPAGTFRLTLEDANRLATGEVPVAKFYVENVIF